MSWVRKTFIFFSILLFLACVVESYEESPYKFRGVHFLASYCDCDLQAMSDIENLIAAMSNAVEKSGATILKTSSWVFPPSGLTMVFLLSESHASIHTYPEHGACFVDLFTCGEKCSAEKFDTAIREYLKPKVVNQRTLIRDEGIQDKSDEDLLHN
jgi:S-adenosylmethionine decarboxylase proenzyme